MLALGDVDFVDCPDAKDGYALTGLAEATRPRLEAAARLLDVSPDAILSALTSRKINAGISSQVGYALALALAFFFPTGFVDGRRSYGRVVGWGGFISEIM